MRRTFTYNGKRYYVSGKSEKECMLKIAEKKLRLEQDSIEESNIRVKDYCLVWLETFKEGYVSDYTLQMYRSAFKTINEYIGGYRLKDVTAEQIQKIITEEHANGSSKSKVDKLILTLRQMFAQAQYDNKIKKSPAERIRRPKMEETTGRALTDFEYNAVLKVCETSRYGLWIKTMLLMGLRPSETSRIKLEHINIDKGVLYVDGTKTAKARRYVPIPDSLKADLSRFSGIGYLFTTNAGKPLSKQARERWWAYFKRELDLFLGAKTYRNHIIESKLPPDLKPYNLRHTFATKLSPILPINHLADIMGHSNINVTRKYYIHHTDAQTEIARSAMNALK